MCGSSDSFPAPLRLRGRKGENFGPPDMNFSEEPEVRGPGQATPNCQTGYPVNATSGDLSETHELRNEMLGRGDKSKVGGVVIPNPAKRVRNLLAERVS